MDILLICIQSQLPVFTRGLQFPFSLDVSVVYQIGHIRSPSSRILDRIILFIC